MELVSQGVLPPHHLMAALKGHFFQIYDNLCPPLRLHNSFTIVI